MHQIPCILLACCCFIGSTAHSQVFDVTEWTESSALGIANGIPFSYRGPNWPPGVTTDNSFTGFADPAHHDPPLATSDRIHIWYSGTFEFGQEISGLYLHMAQHELVPNMDILDFGIVPMVISGDIWTDGTKVGTTSREGGLIFLPGINSHTLSFSSPSFDGFCVDVALVPIAVSEPVGLGLACSAIVGVIIGRHRRDCSTKKTRSVF